MCIRDRVHSFDEFKAYLFTHPQKALDLTWHRTDPSGKQDSYSARICLLYTSKKNFDANGISIPYRHVHVVTETEDGA